MRLKNKNCDDDDHVVSKFENKMRVEKKTERRSSVMLDRKEACKADSSMKHCYTHTFFSRFVTLVDGTVNGGFNLNSVKAFSYCVYEVICCFVFSCWSLLYYLVM